MRRTRMWQALAIALTLSVGPVPGGAQGIEDPSADRWSWKKFWDYGGCTATVAVASDLGTAIAAIMACGKAITTYWTE